MQNKSFRIILMALAGLILVTACFSTGIITGLALPRDLPESTGINLGFSDTLFQTPTPIGAAAEPVDIEEFFKPFWRAWDVVHDQYVDQPVDDVALMQGAIRGMLDALGDPHTAYMNPSEFDQLNLHQEGQYEGIGAWVDTSGDYLIIISPMPNSPAEEAGLKPGDEVLAIDGEDMTGVDGDLVLNRILGPAGSIIIMTIRREGVDEPFDVEITRAEIIVPSVEGEMLEDNIAYVHIYTFGDTTTRELRRELKKLMADEPIGLIIDLRNNGGGYLHTAIEVTSQFVEVGEVIMYEEFADGSRKTLTAQRGGLATDIPLVVLVNEGTASASEITAGAIQDYGIGQLVGITTFGKGSVQNIEILPNSQGALRVTVARWLTPNERHIHGLGLEPDVEVEFTEEDLEAERDPQLEEAIKLLRDQ